MACTQITKVRIRQRCYKPGFITILQITMGYKPYETILLYDQKLFFTFGFEFCDIEI